jgi:3-hydroxyanthranilate 3,4-dioxygenase
MSRFATLNFKKWIDEHRHLLKPPVGNKCIYAGDFIVMVVGGPNARKDFHIDDGEEFFYQLEGDITLKLREDGKVVDLPIRGGEIFLLPPRVPHSPQRPPNTVGLVIERQRAAHEKDGFAWYCEQCGHTLYEEFLHVTNLVTQLPPVFERFWGDPKHTKCGQCGAVMAKP